MLASDVYNDFPMAFLVGLAMLIVIVQPTINLVMGWKHGKEIGISEGKMKTCIKSSAVFAIVPTLPLLVSYLTLSPALGKYFAMLRLSVMGNAAYETAVADMAVTGLGYEDLYDPTIDVAGLSTMMWVVTLAILGGSLFCILFIKPWEKLSRTATTKVGGIKMIGLFTSVMLVGMYSTLAAPHVTNTAKPLGIVAFFVSVCVTILCTHLSKKVAGIRQFTFTISMIAGMLSASIISLLMN